MYRLILSFLLVGGSIGCSRQPEVDRAQGLREVEAAQTQDVAPKEHSMTGCLERSETPGMFVLTDGMGMQLAQIADATPDLGPHVGHKVEITGSAVPKSRSHSMNVTNLQMVAPTCP